MTDALDMHAASPEEVAAAHRNVFDIWSKGLPLDEHVRSRLESPKHTLATWYVGCVGDRVAVSLGAYPLQFHFRGQIVPGIAIGSVYTVPKFRRCGFAEQLLAWVEAQTHGSGGILSLLYSDIKPEYYAKMGYQLCPSLEGARDLGGHKPSNAATRLIEISAAGEIDRLAGLYAGYHGAAPLAIARDASYWQALLRRFEDDRFFALVANEKRESDWQGYVRLASQAETWRITDYALASDEPGQAEALYAAAIDLAASSGAKRFGGWLPDDPAARAFFEITPRRTEITMVKSLSADHPLGAEMIAAAGRFCEIDHV